MPNGEWSAITVDSGAVDNVCPKEWAQEFGSNEVSEANKIRFVGPNGAHIEHHGNRLIKVKAVSSVF